MVELNDQDNTSFAHMGETESENYLEGEDTISLLRVFWVSFISPLLCRLF